MLGNGEATLKYWLCHDFLSKLIIDNIDIWHIMNVFKLVLSIKRVSQTIIEKVGLDGQKSISAHILLVMRVNYPHLFQGGFPHLSRNWKSTLQSYRP